MSIILNKTLTADGSTAAATITNPNNGTGIYQCIIATGTFGSGTLSIEVSNDGGSTYAAATYDDGTAITMTAGESAKTSILGNSDPVAALQVKIRATLASSSGASVKVVIYDVK